MPAGPVNILSQNECLEKLAGQRLGRIVVRRHADMDIFPINYVLDAGDLYFRTAEGAKLFSIALNSDVLFEVDEVTETHAWSVVARGHAHVLRDTKEIQHADTLALQPWVPTLKYNFVRMTITSLSGRAFALGAEPERY
ncbi:pyridoxamine 5'-phosphate oxidase family protein [Corynebacterium sp. ES2794-CONJ1]|uniref:pyridoxamine 5'-phosphate oxidase family protein n=1 Tax=unclassified Corynebacterium TaxID=2624378 RepID=UPI0021681C0E|nr:MULTISPECIES: pyridoxamine 5'-phosphate oxidase family protein [unclassified Corynebacterium]MCS4490634.1 pyridoxamine 5'-phosphate oxidase family protein [Corynebacterium sp. ES2775-CONJ]MCS4532601.1 pyridoxamine 5'-phosphate oxidase family protein [Corynebacterium sp. ES2730-CONJ]MCU9519996.1 pyridoxamine 5'-phosphate oxidase family protein [Corynebacterium sp. ES2794-CONJ1]